MTDQVADELAQAVAEMIVTAGQAGVVMQIAIARLTELAELVPTLNERIAELSREKTDLQIDLEDARQAYDDLLTECAKLMGRL